MSAFDKIFLPEGGIEQLRTVTGMNNEELDGLPIGAIRLDVGGKILAFNRTESALSGFAKEAVLGRNFFTEIAPCTNVQRFAGRFRDGVAKKELHAVFPYHFKFAHGAVDVTVTLYYHKASDTVWVLVRRD